MGWVFQQHLIKPEQLADKIIELANFRTILKTISTRLLERYSNAESLLADAVEKITKNNKN